MNCPNRVEQDPLKKKTLATNSRKNPIDLSFAIAQRKLHIGLESKSFLNILDKFSYALLVCEQC